MAHRFTSSPDPLNRSRSLPSPEKSHRRRISLPMAGISPSKQTFELEVGNTVSPQRIRVTVEADQYSDEEMYQASTPTHDPSPVYRNTRRQETTTTTRVPVKGLSDTEDATPKQGRGRRVITTPLPSRTSTRKRKSIGDLVDDDEDDDWDFKIGQGVEVSPPKQKITAQSSRRKSGHTIETPATQRTTRSANPVSTDKNKAGGRKSMPAEGGAAVEDAGATGPTQTHAAPENRRHSGRQASLAVPRSSVRSDSPSSESAYSTIRSTATATTEEGSIGEEGDVTLAVFDPREETPERVGWTSPQNIGVVNSDHADREQERNYGDSDQYYDDVNGADYRESDTILEGEGFSMISVDSVPSIRQHLNSPAIRELRNNLNSAPDKATHLPEDSVQHDYSGGIAASRAPTTATTEANPANQSVQSLKSHIAAFAKNIQTRKGAAPGGNASKPALRSAVSQLKQAEIPDDSFSTIPSSILRAASPLKIDQTDGSSSSSKALRDERFTPGGARQLVTRSSPSVQNQPQRLPTPETTPSPTASEKAEDEEPEADNEKAEAPSAEVGEQRQGNSSMLNDRVSSSPPSTSPARYTYTAHLRQKRDLRPAAIETPSIVFSSPQLPALPRGPPAQSDAVQHGQSALNARPELSPVARTGRALHDSIQVPSTPRARSNSLRSPFTSPGGSGKGYNTYVQNSAKGRSNSSFKPDAPRLGNIPELAVQRDRDGRVVEVDSDVIDDSTSDDQSHSRPDVVNSHVSFTSSQVEADRRRQEKLEEEWAQERATVSRKIAASKDVVTISSDSDNSDMEDDNEPRNDESHRSADEDEDEEDDPWLAEAQRSSSIIRAGSQEIDDEVDDDQASHEEEEAPEEDDSDEDMWLAEAQRSSSIVTSESRGYADDQHTPKARNRDSPSEQLRRESPKRAEAPRLEFTEGPRRRKIPSPWRQNSKRLVYSDGLADTSTTSRASSQRNSEESQATGGSKLLDFKPLGSAERAEKAASLFGSTLSLSQTTVELSSGTVSSRRSRRSSSTDEADETFPGEKEPSLGRIPQKMNFNPQISMGEGCRGVSSLFASKPSEPAQAPRPSSTAEPPSFRKPLAISSPNKVNLQSSLDDDKARPPLFGKPSKNALFQTGYPKLQPGKSADENIFSIRPAAPSSALEEASSPPPARPSLSPLRPEARAQAQARLGLSTTTEPAKPEKAKPSLSSDLWTKSHWALLDKYYQRSKISSPKKSRAIEDNPKLAALLGKQIFSQGTSMVLERWHLELVSKFLKKVPGWEEQIVAKRLFAIIVGEERRLSNRV